MRRRTKQALLAAAAALALPAFATDRTFVGTNSWFDFTSNWSPAGLPISGDTLHITTAGAADNYCHYRSTNPGWVYGSLYVQSTNGGTAWLWNDVTDPATTLYAGALNLGYDGKGHILQRVGTWTFSGTSYLGRNAGANGEYDLDGGTANFGNLLYIGNYGTGYFKQSAGTVNVAGSTTLGFYSTGNGQYDFSSGTLNSGDTTADSVTVGRDGAGLFHHNGGTHTIAGTLLLGQNAGSDGQYWQEKFGTSAPSLTCENATVGAAGSGLWRVVSGSATVSQTLAAGSQAGGAGTIFVSDSTFTATTAQIGSAGTATLTIAGSSSATITGDITLASSTGSSGTLTVYGGTTDIKGNVYSGDGTSTVDIDGGTLIPRGGIFTVKFLNIGSGNPGSWNTTNTAVSVAAMNVGKSFSGSYAQSGGSLAVSGAATIGGSAPGTYTLSSNGTLSVGTNLVIADQASGDVDLQYGFIQVAQNLIIGSSQTGSYTQSGQTSVNGSVFIAEKAGSQGTLYLEKDYLYAGDVDTDTVWIGKAGAGKVQQTGGTLQASGRIYVGDAATSISEYHIEDDPGISGYPRVFCDTLYLGNAGNALFESVGGWASISGDVRLGELSGGKGQLRQTGGTTTVGGTLFIGNAGTGEATILSSATVTVTGPIRLANSGGTGTFTLSGGTASASDLTGGPHSTLQLNSGSLTLTSKSMQANTVQVGAGVTSTVSYTLASDYQLTATSLWVGSDANTTFIQRGPLSATNAYVGDGMTGQWQVRNTATISGDACAGYDSPGTIQVWNTLNAMRLYSGSNSTGGMLSIYIGASATTTGSVYAGDGFNGAGTIYMQGGTLQSGNSTSDSVYVGYHGTGVMNHFGGTHTAPGTVYLGYYAGSAGEYHLDDDLAVVGVYPSLSARSLYIGNSGTGVYTQSGATSSAAISQSIWVGYDVGSSGAATVGGGTLSVTYDLTVGQWGTGSMEVTGGAANIGRDVWLGAMSGGVGSLTVSGGRLNVTGTIVAGSGSTLTISSGTATASNYSASASSYLQLNGGTFAVSTHSIQAGIVRIGAGSTATAAYTLPSDYQMSAASLYIGKDANATFSQYGSLTAASAYVGAASGKTGSWQVRAPATLSGTLYAGQVSPGTIDAYSSLNTSVLYCGYDTTNGMLAVRGGGSVSATSTVYVGDQVGSSGTIYVQGGTLQTGDTSSDNVYVGRYGTGIINNTGGAHTAPGTMYVGRYAGASGEYHLDDDPVIVGVYPSLTGRTIYVGYSGAGVFTQSGPNTTGSFSQSIWAGYNAGATGAMTVSSGTLSVTYDLTLGQWGAGSMVIDGGQVNIGRDVWLAALSGGTGSLSIAGGQLNVTGQVRGYGGSSLRLDGGDLSVTSGQINVENIIVSSTAPHAGHFNLASGNVTANILTIGSSYAGTMTQSGGTLSVTADLMIGSAGSLISTFSISDTASAHVAGSVSMGGADGIGVIDQSGGSLTVDHSMTLGTSGQGNVQLRGGAMTIGTDLLVGDAYGRHGSFTQSGGTLAINNTAQVGGTSGDGSLAIVGGQATIGSSLQIRDGGIVSLAGGKLTLPSDTALSVSGTGAFSFAAGELCLANNAILSDSFLTSTLGSTRTLGSGQTLTAAASAELRARLTIDGGQFTFGTLTNPSSLDFKRGTVRTTSGLTIGTGQPFGSALTIRQDQTWQGTMVTINSGASVTLSGGILRSDASIMNSGRLSGTGTVSGMATNYGEVSVAAADQLVFDGMSFMNTGTVRLLGGEVRFGGNVNNQAAGFITGRGTLTTAGIMNMGVMSFSGSYTDVFGDVNNMPSGKIICTGGGTLTFYDDVVNNSFGEIRTSAGCSTVFMGGLSGSGKLTGTGTVYSEGDLRPGQSPGLMQVEGNLSLSPTSALHMELAGTSAGLSYDQIIVNGELDAAGIVNVSLINGYIPALGQSFDLVLAGSFYGSFDQVNLPVLPASMSWDVNQTASSLNITAVPEPAMLALTGICCAALMRRRRTPARISGRLLCAIRGSVL